MLHMTNLEAFRAARDRRRLSPRAEERLLDQLEGLLGPGRKPREAQEFVLTAKLLVRYECLSPLTSVLTAFYVNRLVA